MTLKEEIKPYIDQHGFVQPQMGGSSNNGVMYSSESLIALIRNKEATPQDIENYLTLISGCMPIRGLLMRSPDNTGGQEGPDDYYGLFAALDEINSKELAQHIVTYALHHYGAMNTDNPGHFSWQSFLIRQPQLDAMGLWCAGKFVGPFLQLYTAITILLSCRNTPVGDTDSRRLAWLLIQVASRHSWICKQAAKVWYKRLYKDYGPLGMKMVAAIYYGPNHPFAKYWVDSAR